MLSRNQEKVLLAFKRHGILTLEEVRKTSPYWNQAIKVLRNRGLVKWENDGRYSVTNEGGATIAQLEWEGQQEQQSKDMATGNLNAWLGYPE